MQVDARVCPQFQGLKGCGRKERLAIIAAISPFPRRARCFLLEEEDLLFVSQDQGNAAFVECIT